MESKIKKYLGKLGTGAGVRVETCEFIINYLISLFHTVVRGVTEL
jgi:hypothetical protein